MARLPAGFSRRSDGRLQLVFTFDRKRYSVYGKTVKECKEKEITKREQLAKGIEKRKYPTVSEYSGKWQENREKQVSTATQRTQEHITRTIMSVPIQSASKKFGELKLVDVTADDLREVQRKLLEGWRPKEEKEKKNAHKEDRERTTQTVNDYMALLKHIFKDAKKERLIDYNPTELIDNLKRTEERARDTKHRALTEKEQKAFFEAERTKTSSYYGVFRMAILTGMRCGEIGALQNRDIKGGYIHVERTITRCSAGYYIGDDAKTEAGKRSIPLSDAIRKVIAEQRSINEMLFNERALSPKGIIFKAPEGGLLMATPADREIRTICKEIGMEPFTMHGLRATYATRCIEGGMNHRTLQELLGHSNYNLTMSLYGHVVDKTKEEECARIKIII